MAPSKNRKKRVRIQIGHETRFIEKSVTRKRNKKKLKKSKAPRRSIIKGRIGVRVGKRRIYRPSVSELVYQYLERASNRGVVKNQKSNATNQFRRLQRRQKRKINPKKLPRVPGSRTGPPNNSQDCENKIEQNITKIPYRFPYTQLPSVSGKKCIEKCIFDVLTFGTMLGLLVPADDKGMLFRISSDLELLKKEDNSNR